MKIKRESKEKIYEEVDVDFPLYVYEMDSGDTWFSELAFRVDEDGRLYKVQKRLAWRNDTEGEFEIEVGMVSFDNGLGWFLDKRGTAEDFYRLFDECCWYLGKFPAPEEVR